MAKPAKADLPLYDGDAEDAARFLRQDLSIHPSARCIAHRELHSGKRGLLTVEFAVMGFLPRAQWRRIRTTKHSRSGRDRDQAETDRYWNAIVGNGGESAIAAGARTSGDCSGDRRSL
jgi:2-polyprenyl-6-hydroxyphenyl methylase/3-demethylubiquinone-9 3-methyltransferase